MQNTFEVAVTDTDPFDQPAEIARLKEAVKRTAEDPNMEPLCLAIEKFIELDLLRYGNLPTTATRTCGFLAVRRSETWWRFISEEILPAELTSKAILELLGDGLLAVDTTDDKGRPDLVFFFPGEPASPELLGSPTAHPGH
jgi:hypothetical protein